MEYWVIKMLISNILTYFSSKNINLMNCSKRYLCAHGFVSLLSPPCVRGGVLIWALCPGNTRGECLFLYPCDYRVSYLPSMFLSDIEILSVFGILPSVPVVLKDRNFFLFKFLKYENVVILLQAYFSLQISHWCSKRCKDVFQQLSNHSHFCRAPSTNLYLEYVVYNFYNVY